MDFLNQSYELYQEVQCVLLREDIGDFVHIFTHST